MPGNLGPAKGVGVGPHPSWPRAPSLPELSSGGKESQLTTLKAQVGTAEAPVSSRYFSQQKLSGSG